MTPQHHAMAECDSRVMTFCMTLREKKEWEYPKLCASEDLVTTHESPQIRLFSRILGNEYETTFQPVSKERSQSIVEIGLVKTLA